MKYMLLICDEEAKFNDLSEAEIGEVLQAYGKFTNDLKEAGAFVDAYRLRDVATATTVRVRDGKTLTTDGPFAETKEQFGGYYLIDVDNLDDAIKWASQVPSATIGSIEVRPVWE